MIDEIKNMSREELLKLVQVYAKNRLEHDGCRFSAAEANYDLEKAIELDTFSRQRFAAAEAKRIMYEFDIPVNGGLKTLGKNFNFKLYRKFRKDDSARKPEPFVGTGFKNF